MNIILKIQNRLQIINVSKRYLNSSNTLNRRPPHHRSLFRSKQFPFNTVYYDNDSAGPFKVVIDELSNYPPGQWGSMPIKDAWRRYKEMKHLQQLPTNIDKILSMNWTEYNMFYHTIDMPIAIAETLEFSQFITRTKIDYSIPDSVKDSFSNISAEHIQVAVNMLTAHINNYFAQRHKFIYEYDVASQQTKSTEYINQIMDAMHRSTNRTGFYENYTTAPQSLIETFIKRHGYNELKVPENVKDAEGCIHYRLRGKLAWQMRSRDPLKEFVNKDDPIFTSDGTQFPNYNFHPKTFDLEPTDCHDFRNLPFYHNTDNSECVRYVPGFWGSSHVKPGDPCGFSVLGVINSNHSYKLISEFLPNHPEIVDRHFVSEGVLNGFVWTMAQAMNQGFTIYDELTYPICTSLLFTDGHTVQMMYYQLNSIASLWKPEDAGHPVNMMWVSPKTKLYELNEKNEVVTVNEHAVHQILASFLMPRAEMSSDNLQPYLQEKSARDIEHFVISFDPKKATEKELEEYKKRIKIRQLFNFKRPHPNHLFYANPNYSIKLNTELRKIVPGIECMPRSMTERLKRYSLERQKNKGKKKLLPMPSKWQ